MDPHTSSMPPVQPVNWTEPTRTGPPISAMPYPDPFSHPVQAPRQPGRRAFLVLIGAAVVLAVMMVFVVSLGWGSVTHVRREVSRLQAQDDAERRQDAAAAAQRQTDFNNLDLSAKFARISVLDQAVDTAVLRWQTGTERFEIVTDAINACNDAIDEYDRIAAPFPDKMFNTVPKRINLKNPATDCGRAVTQNI